MMTRYFTSKEKYYYCMLIGMISIVACAFTMMFTFFVALSHPSLSTVVSINVIGEAIPEAILLLFAIPFMVFASMSMRSYLRRLKDEIVEEKEDISLNEYKHGSTQPTGRESNES